MCSVSPRFKCYVFTVSVKLFVHSIKQYEHFSGLKEDIDEDILYNKYGFSSRRNT